MHIFLICPVNEVTDEEKIASEKYVFALETAGHTVHWPPRNTNQVDPVGLRICKDNRQAIIKADEVHVWWNGKSKGSFFDFGMAFALGKKIVLANPDDNQRTPLKSFTNVLHEISGSHA